MKVSLVIPVLNSHEIVRRQGLYWNSLNLPDDIEIILVDDGSAPPIECDCKNVKIIKTEDFRKWTHPKARNIGIRASKGETLIITDIDHVITKDIFEMAMSFEYDYCRFRRELAVLDKNGVVNQDRKVLRKYGVPRSQRMRLSCHVLSMIMKRSVYDKTGGYRENLGKHPTHDDGDMKRKLRRFKKAPDKNPDIRPLVYALPNGRFCKTDNPHNLFHDLKR